MLGTYTLSRRAATVVAVLTVYLFVAPLFIWANTALWKQGDVKTLLAYGLSLLVGFTLMTVGLGEGYSHEPSTRTKTLMPILVAALLTIVAYLFSIVVNFIRFDTLEVSLLTIVYGGNVLLTAFMAWACSVSIDNWW